MKKLFLGSIILLIFSISALIFQISCTKNSLAQQQNTNGLRQLNKIVYEFYTGPQAGIWMANYDGSNPAKVNIAVPQGMRMAFGARLSPDGKTIFFVIANAKDIYNLYSCNVDGSNVHEVVDGTSDPNQEDMTLDGVY